MAFVRATQEILVVAYNTATALRVSSIAIEVIRSQAGTEPVPHARIGYFMTSAR